MRMVSSHPEFQSLAGPPLPPPKTYSHGPFCPCPCLDQTCLHCLHCRRRPQSLSQNLAEQGRQKLGSCQCLPGLSFPVQPVAHRSGHHKISQYAPISRSSGEIKQPSWNAGNPEEGRGRAGIPASFSPRARSQVGASFPLSFHVGDLVLHSQARHSWRQRPQRLRAPDFLGSMPSHPLQCCRSSDA